MTESAAVWNDEKVCKICGKVFSVLHPSRWAYKSRAKGASHETYFCSWHCLREDEKGREERVAIILTEEQKRTACEMALKMESPLPYLKSLGVKNPTVGWDSCLKWAERELDPDAVVDLPRRFGQKKPEKAERPEVMLVYDESIAEEYRREQAGKMMAQDEASMSALSDEYRTTAIRKDGVGEFYYDQKRGTIDWRNEYSEEVSMKPEYWEKLADEIPKMIGILCGERRA